VLEKYPGSFENPDAQAPEQLNQKSWSWIQTFILSFNMQQSLKTMELGDKDVTS
jgi:hypothetical protein